MRKLENDGVRVNIMLDEPTNYQLDCLAGLFGTSRSGVIRWLISEEWKRIEEEKKGENNVQRI